MSRDTRTNRDTVLAPGSQLLIATATALDMDKGQVASTLVSAPLKSILGGLNKQA